MDLPLNNLQELICHKTQPTCLTGVYQLFKICRMKLSLNKHIKLI